MDEREWVDLRDSDVFGHVGLPHFDDGCCCGKDLVVLQILHPMSHTYGIG